MIEHQRDIPQSPRRVVILGGTGFLGSALARRLASEQVSVESLSSRKLNLVHPEAPQRLMALLQAEDAVVFAAALTPDRGRDSGAFLQNAAMAHHVGQVLHERAVAHVVYVSSDAVYADSVHLAHEQARCEPSSLYGLMHLARERMVQEAAATTAAPILIVRPTLLYGAGDTHNAYGPNRFIRTAQSGGKITLFGHGEELRDHVHINDAAALIAEMLSRRTTGLLNLASGVSTSFADIAAQVVSRMPGNINIERLPRRQAITHRHFDTAELVRHFPRFRFRPLSKGLAELCESAKTGDSSFSGSVSERSRHGR